VWAGVVLPEQPMVCCPMGMGSVSPGCVLIKTKTKGGWIFLARGVDFIDYYDYLNPAGDLYT
jgi:hypothetical protein